MNTNKRNCEAFKAFLRTGVKINLLLINVDNFSNINDSYGIEYGDLIFEKIKIILNNFKFKDVEIYKLESDEFSIVNCSDFDINTSIEIANEITSFFNESEIELDEELNIKISLSIGIATGRGISVLNNTRTAIKELRLHTRGTYKVYDMKSPFVRDMQKNVYWVNMIQTSVAEDSVVAFFQPIVNNNTNKITKYECLARIHDDGAYVSPFEFMNAAKEARVISLITKSIIKQACKVFSKNDYEFSINITNDDLQLEYLEEYLLRNIRRYDINPSRVVLELLEDIPTLEKGTILKQLFSLQEKGFKLSVDDFGSESSNFSRLLEFKPDYLKIDGSFIKNILEDEKSQIITTGIVSIAHRMDIKIIAEYIHSQAVQDKIKDLGVDFSQGYFFGEPSRELVKV